MQFRGHVRDLPLSSLLSVLHEQRRSHDVRLSDAHNEGLLVVRDGALVHAELAQQRGLGAFAAACQRSELVYEVSAPAHDRARTVVASHAQLLALAAAEHASEDEFAAGEAERVSQVMAERARASRSVGTLAVGLAVVLAGMLMLLKPHAHAGEHAANQHADKHLTQP